MIRASIEIPRGFMDDFRRNSIQRIERALMTGTHKAASGALGQIRAEMQSRQLGRLGNALGMFSDLKKGKVYRLGGDAFSASAGINIRSKSPRTVGAIISYTEGSNIRPVKGRWLWFPTPDIQRLVGSGKARQRLTPALWERYGLDTKIGPLQLVRSVNGNPLLVVKNVGVSLAGKRGSARSLTKSGRPRKGQVERSFVVAFIAIPFTARAQRVDVLAIAKRWAALVPDFVSEELGRRT